MKPQCKALPYLITKDIGCVQNVRQNDLSDVFVSFLDQTTRVKLYRITKITDMSINCSDQRSDHILRHTYCIEDNGGDLRS